ncbi:MBL fold metallo-hydrolase [Alteromonas gracilis]
MSRALVTALGHAGLRISTPRTTVLLDPWISPGGAFLGSWFPFPDNGHLAGPPLQQADLVVVSHEHLDHLDLAFLADLPAHVPVVVPRYPATIMERRLAAIGREHVIVLDPWERHHFGPDDWLTVIPEHCPMSHDSAVLVHVGGRTVLHTNDARISLAQARRAAAEAGGIDAMGIQMSGASWHPVCYEYDAASRAEIDTVKRIGKFKAATRLVRGTRPRLVMPYAGPPAFLDESLFEHNPGLHGPGIFPDQEEAATWLRDHLREQQIEVLLPGDSVDPATLRVHRDPEWTGFDLRGPTSARREYLQDYARRRRPWIQRAWDDNPVPAADSGLGPAFAAHMTSLGLMSQYFLARIGLTMRFEVAGPAGGVWDVHLGPDRLEVDLDGGDGPAGYVLRMDGRWLAGVVSGRTRWEELLLSLRFSARREPDHYNDYLVGLLKHADVAALRAVEAYEATRDPGETMRLRVGDRHLEVSRFCPHAGEDMAEIGLVVEGDRLRCLGHNFEFDLTTGACVNAACDPIRVRDAAMSTSS